MLYMMRHGKTDWNAVLRLQGRTDIPLNDEGRQMARDAREKNKAMHFDICYCSPLLRAKETAEIFFEGSDTPIVYDDRLREMSFGIFEGMEDYRSVKEGPIYDLFYAPERFTGTPEGETFANLYARTCSILNERILPDVASGKNVLIIGHGAMNSSIACQINHTCRKDYWKLSIGNCELHKLL